MSFRDTTGVKGPWAPFSLESAQLTLPPNFRLYPKFRSLGCPQRGHEESSTQCKRFLSTEKLYYRIDTTPEISRRGDLRDSSFLQ